MPFERTSKRAKQRYLTVSPLLGSMFKVSTAGSIKKVLVASLAFYVTLRYSIRALIDGRDTVETPWPTPFYRNLGNRPGRKPSEKWV